MQFASRDSSGNNLVSPLARPYRTNGSVAAYLQDQARSPSSGLISSKPDYDQRDMQRLDGLLQELGKGTINDNDAMSVYQNTPTSLSSPVESLLPGFELPTALPLCTGPILPPTPVESTHPPTTDEPVVRITMHVWNAMGRDLQALKDDKRALETKLARVEKVKQTVAKQVTDYNDEQQTQLGRYQYQNECNKTQKATMVRTISDKDIQIKELQLEMATLKDCAQTRSYAPNNYSDIVAEKDYLQAILDKEKVNSSRALANLTDVKNLELKALSNKVDDLQKALEHSEIQREVVVDNQEYKTLAQTRLDQLNQREKILRAMKERYAAEHTKVGELEDQREDLVRKLNQVGDLQGMLREKSSECDRFRTQLKLQEKRVEDFRQRTLRAANNGETLRGAAHLVKPQANTKFSSLVLGCSECYAKNITCDNKARCQHCTENNEVCARWRCSLKHKLGTCPDTPCRLPHDDAGWLGQVERRPEW